HQLTILYGSPASPIVVPAHYKACTGRYRQPQFPGPVEPSGLLSKPTDPVGARKSKIALGELMRAAASTRVADTRHVSGPARENVTNVPGKYARSVAVSDSMLGIVLLTNEWGNQLLNTAEGTDTSNGHAEGTQPLSETRWESESSSILSEEAPGATTASSRKSAEAREDSYRPDSTELAPHWWRETCMREPCDQGGALRYAGATAVLRVELAGSLCETFLDTGASRSFIRPKTVERLQLKVQRLPEEHKFTVATGEQLRIDRVMTGLTLWFRHARFSRDFLVGAVPYDLFLGLDWLTKHKVAWYFQSDKLQTYVNDQWCELPVVGTGEAKLQGNNPTVVHPRTPAEQAYEILAKQVAGMSTEEAAIFLRPPHKRHKTHAKTKAKARIKSLIRQAAADTKSLRAPLRAEGEEESPWPVAKLEHTPFDEWINSTEAQAIPCEIIEVLQEYRAVFSDTLPKGLPPKRPHDHHILLVPGKLPSKSAIYRMTPDQLTFHKQEIAKLLDSGRIGPTYSPICSPTIMVDKLDNGSGERKMRMVVN
ncbi:hypothetical protein ENH_00011300, partial [Eimeria necatrix]